ncbi:MAG: saccharopine dehydrogenase family protein [Planctomycetota bacterium]|nr:saccharopine dehydrogenase family protein [Planctomycetota bacterium]
MTNAVVLGAGIVGSVIAADLAEDGWDITVADRDPAALAKVRRLAGEGVTLLEQDLADPEVIGRLVAPFELVLGALPGHLGYEALRAVIRAGKDVCDISFMPEDARDHDALAREHGVTAVVDCGVAPGLSNLLCGHAVAMFDDCRMLLIQVGGLPVEPQPPFGYKAAFSPIDVLEEYVRPARYVTNGELRSVEALTDLEIIELPGVPPLESFLTDGLRSLADTLDVPFMKEKTLRYPGHARVMEAFREAGLFGTDPIQVGDVEVRPLDVTTAGLFPQWQYAEGEADLTVMRVEAEGMLGGVAGRLVWDLLDHADLERGFSSMARTTAFPCTLMARELVAGRIPTKGVLPPEALATDAALLERLLDGLAARGVVVQTSSNASG